MVCILTTTIVTEYKIVLDKQKRRIYTLNIKVIDAAETKVVI